MPMSTNQPRVAFFWCPRCKVPGEYAQMLKRGFWSTKYGPQENAPCPWCGSGVNEKAVYDVPECLDKRLL